jgi:hypothetical protein
MSNPLFRNASLEYLGTPAQIILRFLALEC